MANQALSKSKIRLMLPRDMSNIQREGKAAPDSEFTAGSLLCRLDGQLELCDITDATNGTFFEYAPVEVLWIDGVHRVDLVRIKKDGTEFKELTTIAFDCMAEVDVSCFTETPAEGEFLLRATEGKMEPVTLAELHAKDTDDGHHLIVGQVVEDGSQPNKFVVKFKLS